MLAIRTSRAVYIALACACAIGFATTVYAQTGSPSLPQQLVIETSPRMPGAHEEVHVTLQSFSLDLDRAAITWRVNGTVHSSGAGLTTITVTTGALGEATVITAQVAAPGGSATARTTVRPAAVSVLWEANTYTPPFYRGRALPTDGSTVRATAIAHFVRPNGSRVQAEDIIYTWKVNGRILGDISGRGKSTVTLPSPGLFGEMAVTAEAESVDYAYQGSGTVAIANTEPYLALYPDYPAGGIAYHTALTSSAEISDSEFTVTAIPYFAAVAYPRDPSLQYEWTVNGSSVPADPADPSRITLGLEGGTRGVARIQLTIDHLRHLLQTAEQSWILRFSSSNSSSNNPFRRSVDLE